MSDKIKVWECDQCDQGCVVTAQHAQDISNCDLKCWLGLGPVNWRETDDYEIVEKKKVVPGGDEWLEEKRKAEKNNGVFIHFADLKEDIEKKGLTPGELKEKNPELFKKLYGNSWKLTDKTPNCAVCMWSCLVTEDECYNCSAQGYKFTAECYNTDECKALFETAEEKTDEDLTAFRKAEKVLAHCMANNQDIYQFKDSVYKLNLDECTRLAETRPYSLNDIKNVFWNGGV